MSQQPMNPKEIVRMVIFFAIIVFIVVGLLWGINAVYKKYKIWTMEQDGRAELSKAEWTKKIAIEEARAKTESAKLLAQAEVERAKGVAEANKIIGESLKDNEAYLKYLWIQGLQENDNDVIYVPTEANLPILEATRNLEK